MQPRDGEPVFVFNTPLYGATARIQLIGEPYDTNRNKTIEELYNAYVVAHPDASSVYTALNAEITSRINGDSNLQAQVNTLIQGGVRALSFQNHAALNAWMQGGTPTGNPPVYPPDLKVGWRALFIDPLAYGITTFAVNAPGGGYAVNDLIQATAGVAGDTKAIFMVTTLNPVTIIAVSDGAYLADYSGVLNTVAMTGSGIGMTINVTMVNGPQNDSWWDGSQWRESNVHISLDNYYTKDESDDLLALKAPIDSPILTGTPESVIPNLKTAPETQIETVGNTRYVLGLLYGLLRGNVREADNSDEIRQGDLGGFRKPDNGLF